MCQYDRLAFGPFSKNKAILWFYNVWALGTFVPQRRWTLRVQLHSKVAVVRHADYSADDPVDDPVDQEGYVRNASSSTRSKARKTASGLSSCLSPLCG
mmetsp:Transcript_2032/g.5613  ORF Transcript_2032/g.5613 Transcript_2032/m.5613 type:complete len:98 (+) Transcript_2032:599-892(+)